MRGTIRASDGRIAIEKSFWFVFKAPAPPPNTAAQCAAIAIDRLTAEKDAACQKVSDECEAKKTELIKKTKDCEEPTADEKIIDTATLEAYRPGTKNAAVGAGGPPTVRIGALARTGLLTLRFS